MKAALLLDYDNKKIKYSADATKPKITPGQLLIEVYYASINPFDIKVYEGILKDKLILPAILGGDFSGVISEISANEKIFKVGQSVFGSANAANGHGSFSEFAPANVSQTALLKSLDFRVAAACPLTCSSAYQAIHDHINLKQDQTILIHGGSGGIGSIAVQLAKNIGATVYATASKNDETYIKELGADMFIDYKNEDFRLKVKNINAVFDTVGGEVTKKSYEVLKPSGILLSMVSAEDNELVKKYNVNFIHQGSKVTTEKLERIRDDILSNQIKIFISKEFKLQDLPQAIEYQKTNHHRGKILIKVKD